MDPKTRMILYYLNELGGGLAGEGHPMQRVGAVTKQQIEAESQMKLIQKLLDGGGTVKRGKTGGIDVSGDMSSILSGMSEEEKTPFAGAPSGMAMNAPGGQIDTQRKQLEQSFLNPSPSPLDISGADLIGLTPENISQALQLKFTGEELERRKLSELMRMMQPAKDERTAEIKNYEYYVAQEKAAGRTPKSIDMWDSGLVRERRLYDEAVASGMSKEENPFHEWLSEYKRLGGTDITIDVAGREVAKGLGKGKAEVMSPGYAQDTLSKLKKDKEWPPMGRIEDDMKTYGLKYEEAESELRKELHIEAMDKEIRQAFSGAEIEMKIDGWYVDGKLRVRNPYAR